MVNILLILEYKDSESISVVYHPVGIFWVYGENVYLLGDKHFVCLWHTVGLLIAYDLFAYSLRLVCL